MKHLHYGDERRTWAGCYRSEIPSRERGPVESLPFIGRLMIALPGFDLDWTLRQDMRDPRRFYAIDLDGKRHEHAAPKELVRHVALIVPRYSAR